MTPNRRALLSVSDKTELLTLARALVRHRFEIISTGGTAKLLAEAGIPVRAVADVTGAPEILDGRVKTLHPKIHGGILARPTAEHQAELRAHDITAIELVVVNLYPFEDTVARPGTTLPVAVEEIDIGGPAMVRASAKNFERVTIVVSPSDYPTVIAELDANAGQVSRGTRFQLAKKAFAHTSRYDGAIAEYLSARETEDAAPAAFASISTVQLERVSTLRYGENPHQSAAFYRLAPGRAQNGGSSTATGLGGAQLLQGKAISYNNLLDLDAALQCVREFAPPAAVIVKHTNPCGVAQAAPGGTDEDALLWAYRRAFECDSLSAFGGVVGLNRVVPGSVARALAETFLECVVAPGFSDEAVAILGEKKNLRLVTVLELGRGALPTRVMRSIAGGVLVQDEDAELLHETKCVTKRAPSESEARALEFAWKVAKHVKSNAIVYAAPDGAGFRTVGIGAGQMSRVDSAEVAKRKAAKAGLDLAGAVVASDAFFPFRDGVDVLAGAGARAVIQPGGSMRDQEVIDAADGHGLAMLFTGMRHFRH